MGIKKNNWRKLGINKISICTKVSWNPNQFSYNKQNPGDIISLNKKLIYWNNELHTQKYNFTVWWFKNQN